MRDATPNDGRPFFPRQTARNQFQAFRKEGQMSERCHRRIRVPFNLDRTSIRIDDHRTRVNIPLNARVFTRRAASLRHQSIRYVPSYQDIQTC